MLGAVIISMNPVVTALLAATFLGESLTPMRVGALALGVLAVLAACAGRLVMVGGVDAVVLLLLVSLFSVGAVACWLNARSRRQRQDAASPTASIMRASSPATSGPAG